MGSGLSKHPDEMGHGVTAAPHGSTTVSTATSRDANRLVDPEVSTKTVLKDDSNANATSTSGCPMKLMDGSYSWDWGALWRPNFPHGPQGSHPLDPATVQQQQQTQQVAAPAECASLSTTPIISSCPVQQSQKQQQKSSSQLQYPQYNVYGQRIDPRNQMPAAAAQQQLPASIQSRPLSTERVASSIPKGGANQDGEPITTWTYPSPQQFYNALVRKGKAGVDVARTGNSTATAAVDETSLEELQESIEMVVALHNDMNEKTWRKVLQWEALTTTSSSSSSSSWPDSSADPKQPTTPAALSVQLLKFQGRPHDLSPKAWFKHWFLGHPLPFDRHDWTVLRSDGTTHRYVMDYYYDESRMIDNANDDGNLNTSSSASLLVDVRPALDSWSALWYRGITMPWARHISQTTSFEPLPLQPSPAMKGQVAESVQVWQAAQQQALSVTSSSRNKDANNTTGTTVTPMKISTSEAKQLVSSMEEIQQKCQAAQRALRQCRDDGYDDEHDAACAKASMDLTVCMGQILCPVQCQALMSSVQAIRSNTNDDDDDVVEAALERLSDCVWHKNEQLQGARQQYPDVFAATISSSARPTQP